MKGSSARLVESPPELSVAPVYVNERDRLPSEQNATEWLWLLWERRRFLARVAVWGLIVSTIIAFIIPKSYESTTRLMPPDSQSGSGMAMMAALAGGGGGIGLSSLAGDLLGMKSSGALFVDILGGRTVQDRLIDRFDLRKVYHDRYWEDARKDLAKYTNISEDRKSGVITITIADHDPHRAAQLAQAYVEELDRLVAQVSTSSARRERIFIEERLQTVRKGMDDASRQFSEYASKNTTIDLTSQAKATVEAAARLEGELIAAQSELEGLEQIYAKGHVRVRSMQARVDELRSQLHKIGGESSDPPADKSLSPYKSSDQEFPSIRQLPLLGVKWADLYRETKVQETVYELLTRQYELAKIQEAKEIPTVKVLDAAYVPEKKSFPKRRVIVIFGMLLAFGAGTVWILGRSAWQQMDPRDPRRVLATEVFATVQARMPKLSWNEAGAESNGHRIWSWSKKPHATSEAEDESTGPDAGQ
ncbi:MAG: lipopolysaccharide biosynthesis protein [Acidobacteriia bacterium]|nr:lipopolysaccharide biosynthesis protein [Terriglobia bacterium]